MGAVAAHAVEQAAAMGDGREMVQGPAYIQPSKVRDDPWNGQFDGLASYGVAELNLAAVGAFTVGA